MDQKMMQMALNISIFIGSFSTQTNRRNGKQLAIQ